MTGFPAPLPFKPVRPIPDRGGRDRRTIPLKSLIEGASAFICLRRNCSCTAGIDLMSHGSGELIAVTRGQWWIRRSLGLFGILCVGAGMALIVQGWLFPDTDLTDRQVILFAVVLVI